MPKCQLVADLSHNLERAVKLHRADRLHSRAIEDHVDLAATGDALLGGEKSSTAATVCRIQTFAIPVPATQIKQMPNKLIIICLFGLMAMQAASAEGSNWQSFRLTVERLQNNTQLTAEDARYFPPKMRSYLGIRRDLDMQKPRFKGFSRQIHQRHFIVATDHGSGGFSSQAVRVFIPAKRKLSASDWDWTPLHLPFITFAGKTTSTSSFSSLRWNEELQAAQTTYCSDTDSSRARYKCARFYHKVHFRETRLLRIDGLRSVGGNRTWSPIWKDGKWTIDGR